MHPPPTLLPSLPTTGQAPTLPFDGQFTVRHGDVDTSGLSLAIRGALLLRGWRSHRSPQDLLLDGPTLLRMAADMSTVSVTEAVALVGSHLSRFHDLTEQSIARLLAEIARFCTYLSVLGVEMLGDVTARHCEDFIYTAVENRAGAWVDPAVATLYLRRTALRQLFSTSRHLTLMAGDPTIDIALPPRSARVTRPLADDEEAAGRLWAQPTLDDTRHATAWELFRCTATGAEASALTVADLDLADGRVWLHGNEKWRTPRWAELTEWGVGRIEAHLASIGTDPQTPLVTRARKRGSRQASVTNLIAEIMTKADLRGDPSIKPGSLSAWAGAKVFERTGRIDEAARAMGVRSLDRAAEIIRCDW